MSLMNATRSELTKQFTTAGWWVLGIILVVYVVFNAGIMAAGMGYSFSESGQSSVPSDVTGVLYGISASAGYIIPLMFGTLMVTTEFRHQLIVPTVLATPHRGMALMAKLLAAVVMGALYGVIALVSAFVTVFALLSLFGIDPGLGESETWFTLARSFAAMVLWALIGVGVGSVIRNQVAAIVVVLAFTMFVEQLLRVGGIFFDWLGDITRWLPGAATDTLIGHSLLGASIGGQSPSDPLEWWVGGMVLLGYAVVLTVLGSLTTWRRDVS